MSITHTKPKFVTVPTTSNLKSIVENLLSQLIYDNKTFTAFDITSRLRKANPTLQIIHGNVRSIVHNYMASSRPGYRSRVTTVGNTNARATEYYSISTVTNPPVTPVVPILVGNTKTVSNSSIPTPTTFKVYVDSNNRIYISKRQVNKLGLKVNQSYKLSPSNTGYELSFSNFINSSNSISARGYIRFKNKLPSTSYLATYSNNKIVLSPLGPQPFISTTPKVVSYTPTPAPVVNDVKVKVSCIITNSGHVFVNSTELSRLSIKFGKTYNLTSTPEGWELDFSACKTFTHAISNRGTLRFKADRKIQTVSGLYNVRTKVLYIG